MTELPVRFEDFARHVNPEECFFHRPSLLTVRDAFKRMASTLPPEGALSFAQGFPGIIGRIHIHADHDEPKLSFQFFPEYESVVIRRIVTGSLKRLKLGTSLIASQFPFWGDMGVRYIDLLCSNNDALAFYKTLGFRQVHLIPEYPEGQQIVCFPMRLDLQNPEQAALLKVAFQKAKPLTDPAFRL